MALSDLTDPEAVRAAMAEANSIGRRAFLNKYNFGSAERYHVVEDGRWYDSKALAGVAHGFQNPTLGPLNQAAFSGGLAAAAGRLEALGFTVVDAKQPRNNIQRHYIYYWREYRENTVAGPIYQLNQNSLVMQSLAKDDIVWAVSLNTPGVYALVGRFVVNEIGSNTPGEPGRKWGSYFFQSTPDATVYFTVERQPNLGDILFDMGMVTSPILVGQSFQGGAGVRLIPTGGMLLTEHAEHLGIDPVLTLDTAAESWLSYRPPASIDETVNTPARKEVRREVLLRNRAHVAALKKLYDGRCQISGRAPLDGIAGDITEAHHIHWLTQGGEDSRRNMVVLSPDWHAAVHSPGVVFDWGDLTFLINGKKVGLVTNLHLIAES